MMLMTRSLGALSGLALVAVGCATAPGTSTGGPLRWTGSFRVPSGSASAVIGPAKPGTAAPYGTLTLTPDAVEPQRTAVNLSISVGVAPGTQLAWGVFTGPCGTPSPSILGPNEFPVIDVTGSGGGSVQVTLPVALDRHQSYHANIYNSSRITDQGDVLVCAKLEPTGGG